MSDASFRPAFTPPPGSASDSAEQGPPPEERKLDRALRPRSLETFVGQERLVANLGVAVQAARTREEPLDHLLLSGLPGLGKTTLSEIIAREMGVNLRATTGPVIERPGDLAGILTALSPGDVLFIDEIHRLPATVEEYLYSAMEDWKLVIVLDQGPRSRSVPVSLHPFTLVGATTREGLLSAPFRARFGLHERVEPYDEESLVKIVARAAALLELALEPDAARAIAVRARGTPRVAHRYLRRVRDTALVAGADRVDAALARAALDHLGVDARGLLAMDRRLLEVLRAATPHAVGVKALAVAVGEEERTIEEVYEPFLIRLGFLARTPRGRVLTSAGEAHLASLAS